MPCVQAFDAAVKVDNPYVLVTEMAQAPGATLELQASPAARLLVSVGAGDIETIRNGQTQREHWIPGHTLLVAAGQPLTCKNAGTSSIRLVEIELKPTASDKRVGRNPKLDPVSIDPKHNVPVMENDQIRVFRSWREPGATEMMHEHVGVGRAAILLTSLDSTVKLGDGSVVASRAAQGDVLWSGPVAHATTNLGSQRFEMIIVEVK